MVSNIPKIIIQTWKDNIIPDKWKEGQNSIINLNPDFKYILLTDIDNRNIVKKYFPYFLDTFDNFKYNIQRADAIRYIVLYLFGGIYLDLDYVELKPFRYLIDELNKFHNKKKIYFVKSVNTPWCITNSFIMSEPRQEFWLFVIREMMKPNYFKFFGKHFHVFTSTGPFMLNKMYNKYKNQIQILDNIIVPCNICNLNTQCQKNNNYYIYPTEGSSWHGNDSKLYNFIYCKRKYIKYVIIFIILIIIFIKYNIYCK